MGHVPILTAMYSRHVTLVCLVYAACAAPYIPRRGHSGRLPTGRAGVPPWAMGRVARSAARRGAAPSVARHDQTSGWGNWQAEELEVLC